MERIPESPPVILPLALQERPLWSVMIPVYNCAHYLPEALQGVLAQAPGKDQMQIEVVDDASTDTNVAALVERLGKGRVGYFRQAENVGSLRNFETCINRARGKLVHLLHGDDRIKEGYYEKVTSLFQKYPYIGAAFSGYRCINDTGSITYSCHTEAKEEGVLQNWLLRIAERQRIQYAAMTVRREVYENLGSFYGMSFGEDWEMWVRIAKHYAVAHTPEILAEYRTHFTSVTWQSVSSGGMVGDIEKAIEIISQHVPPDMRGKVEKKARRHNAYHFVGNAHKLWSKTHDMSLTLHQVQQVFRLSRAPNIYWHVFKLYLKIWLKIDYLNPFPSKGYRVKK